MNIPTSRFLRLLASSISVLLLAAAIAAVWFYRQARASLPQLDGSQPVSGLTSQVTVTRDALGVPALRGATRLDVARALGFVHAQDRFFQMDLLRRRPAGELAELFGKAALPLDRQSRPHHFRRLAEQVLAMAPPAHRELIQVYTAGVNSGLHALGAKPFEYFLLRAEPQAWRPEDCILIAYAMVLDLQDESNARELSLMTLRDQFGFEAVSFFAPLLTADDAALDGTTDTLPPIPGPNVLDLRAAEPTAIEAAAAGEAPRWSPERDPELLPGSNSFALIGAHTATGAALLANDPHLNLGVPNIWYRAVMEWPADHAGSGFRRVVGVTLPGIPFAVLGSNGHIAWGMTTSFVDTGDLVPVELDPTAADLYRVPGAKDLVQIDRRVDRIAVKGAEPETIETPWTVWGPFVGHDARGRPLAHRWTAHDVEATNMEFFALEQATTVEAAVEIVHRSGIPAHNFLVADAVGAIGWTIAGRLPQRVGFDGRMPVSWSFGDRRWAGFLPAAEVPALIVRPDGAPMGVDVVPEPRARAGRLWTANNRIVGGAALARLGDSGYMAPPRAVQVRDQLAILEKATPSDLLALQLDDRALFLARWQKLMLATLTPEAIRQKPARAELRRLVEHWEGRASVESVSYRLVHAFRTATADLVFTPIFARCVAQTPQFNWRNFIYEPALWALLEQKPAHLLALRHASWDDLLLAAADKVVADIDATGTPLERSTWGQRNTAQIQHPLGRVLPAPLARWLNLPADPLPGDTHMPRVQNPSFGASMRLAVSPGREHEGLFQMPGGQSGHPLSPFYRAGHAAWVRGEPSPLLPGPTRHTLTLTP